MRKRSLLNRCLSLMLVLIMVIGTVSVPALASEEEMSVVTDMPEQAVEDIDSADTVEGIDPADTTSGTAINLMLEAGEEYSGQEEDGNYTIGDAEQLATLASMVNSGTSYSGSIFTLLNDIELSGSWTPIGSQAKSFSGIFDGDSNTISGLYISGNLSCQGLFGNLEGAEIKNLTVEGEITATGNYVGGIAGSVNNAAIFRNCTNAVDIKGNSCVGGIVGNASGVTGQENPSVVIENCYNSGEINGDISVGGIAGEISNASIFDCINIGTVAASHAGYLVGGIAGYARDTLISDCRNEGAIKNNGTGVGNTGGIAGCFASNFLTNCVNTGKVSGGSLVGGIVGLALHDNINAYFGISNSYNTGIVEGINTGNAAINFIGGLFGKLDVRNNKENPDDFVIENCYNTGDVTVSATAEDAIIKYVGGLFGQIYSSASNKNCDFLLWIRNCYNAGNVVGGENVGGITGAVDINGIDNRYFPSPLPGIIPPIENPNGGVATASVKITNCYSSGDVKSNSEEPEALGAGIGLVTRTNPQSTDETSDLILSNVFAYGDEEMPSIGKDTIGVTGNSDVVVLSRAQMADESFSTLLGGTYARLSPGLYLKDNGDYDEETYEKYHEIYGDYAYPILLSLSGKQAVETFNVKFEGAGYTTVVANGDLTYATTVELGGTVKFTVVSNYEDIVSVERVSFEGAELEPDISETYTVDNINEDIVINIETEGNPPVEDTEARYEVTFNITEGNSNTPITDAAVTVIGEETENGIYNLKKGTYEVEVKKTGYLDLVGEIEVTSKKTDFSAVLYPESTVKHTINLKMGTASAISPYIVYLYNGDFVIDKSNQSSSQLYTYTETELKNIPAGEYTYWAKATEGNDEWSGITIGGGPISIDEDKEVNLRVVYFWNKLSNNSKLHYTMTMTAADGTEYWPGSTAPTGGIARACFIVPSRYDGAEYQYAFIPSQDGYWGSSGTTYIYDSDTANGYRGINLSDSGQFVISSKVPVSLTVPSGAKLGLYHRVRLYQPLEELKPDKKGNEDGTTTYTYEVPSREPLQYELILDGYVKTAERFEVPANGNFNKIISLESLTPDTGMDFKHPDGLDADIIMNAPDSKYIEMNSGGKYELYCFRNWQAIDTITSNQYVDPVYNVDVIHGTSVEVTDKFYAGAVIKAVDGESGVSLVRVTYGPLEYTVNGKKNLYSKLWEQNTAILVFNVNPQGTDEIDTGIKQSEFETAYYTRSINGIEQTKNKQYAEYTFTPKAKNGTLSKVEIHAPIGSNDTWNESAWTAITANTDGSYTAKLVDGRSLIRVTASDGTVVYRSVRAYGVDVKISGENVDVSLNNNAYNVTADVNDMVKVSFDGLQMPFPKLGAIYNPGFPDKTYLGYTLKGFGTKIEREVMGERSQYDIGTKNTITLTFDSPDTYILTKGGINTSAFGDAAGGHRAITRGGKTGVQSSYTGGNSSENEYGLFCTMPEITINVTGIEDTGTAYTAAIKVPSDSGRLLVRNSRGYIRGADSFSNNVYTYSLYNNEGTETYTYALERPEYVTQTGIFDIKDANVSLDLTSVDWKPITQSGSANVSVVGYETILSDKSAVSISTPAADLYAKYYVPYNHGGYTVLHALLDALEENDAPFTCKNGILSPSITVSGTVGANAGWICEVNGKAVADYANTLVNGGDTVVFYFNPVTASGMRHAWFMESQVTAKRSGSAELTLVSTPVNNDGTAAEPVAGATVYVDDKEWGKTDSSGKVILSKLSDLPLGPHTVTAQLNNTLTFARAVLVIEKDDTGTTTPEGKVTVTFRMIGDTKHEPAYKGYINWIKTEKHVMDKGSTMEDIFKMVLDDNGMSYDNTSVSLQVILNEVE